MLRGVDSFNFSGYFYGSSTHKHGLRGEREATENEAMEQEVTTLSSADAERGGAAVRGLFGRAVLAGRRPRPRGHGLLAADCAARSE